MMQSFRALVLAAGCLIAVSQGAADARAQDGDAAAASREYLIKAAILYNFAKFAKWPADAFRDAETPLRLCILGDDPFGAALETIDGKTIGKRSLVTARIGEAEDAGPCHLLFVSASEQDRLASILDRLRDRPVLTVADMPRFARAGGIIALKVVDDRSRFEINLDAARGAGLGLSAKLLQLAEIVRVQTAQMRLDPNGS